MLSIPSMRGSSYRTAPFWPVLLLPLFASCAQPEPTPTAAYHHAYDAPEVALDAFVEAWNAGDVDALVSTFSPDRRDDVRALGDELRRRTHDSRIAEPRIHTLCHPRGARWKTAEVTVIPKESVLNTPEEHREVVWLRLQRDTWWMYSL